MHSSLLTSPTTPQKLMKTIVKIVVVIAALITALSSKASVPQIISYQGRVTVGSTNFDGAGQFKFALVNSGATITYWSNDGTSVAGSQPSAAVQIAVSKGLYSIQLGSSVYPNMQPISASVFANDNVLLRIWFNDGANGMQQLTPDQRIASVGYAMMADEVRNGAITSAKIANGAVGATQLAAGAAQANLAAANLSGIASSGVIMSQNDNSIALKSAGYVMVGSTSLDDHWSAGPVSNFIDGLVNQQSVWTGQDMILWGRDSTSGAARGARFNPQTKVWTAMSTVNQPSARLDFTATWTGTEMIIWGGKDPAVNPGYLNTGGRYNPGTDSWIPFTLSDLSPRSRHSAVWAPEQGAIIFWGGYGVSGPSQRTGLIYYPSSNSSNPITLVNAPIARYAHSAVWTGTEMIIYGGNWTVDATSSGGRWNPATNTWTPIPDGTILREYHSAVWTGSQMIVFGGQRDGNFSFISQGEIYTPATDSWTLMPDQPAPRGGLEGSVLWSGTELLAWGGSSSTGGGRYNPVTGTWKTLSQTGAPTGRHFHSAAWTGAEMLIVGGNVNPIRPSYSFTPGKEMFLYEKP